MPKWELDPYTNFPQTPEVYIEQLDQEIASCQERWTWLVLEKYRMEQERIRLEGLNENS